MDLEVAQLCVILDLQQPIADAYEAQNWKVKTDLKPLTLVC